MSGQSQGIRDLGLQELRPNPRVSLQDYQACLLRTLHIVNRMLDPEVGGRDQAPGMRTAAAFARVEQALDQIIPALMGQVQRSPEQAMKKLIIVNAMAELYKIQKHLTQYTFGPGYPLFDKISEHLIRVRGLFGGLGENTTKESPLLFTRRELGAMSSMSSGIGVTPSPRFTPPDLRVQDFEEQDDVFDGLGVIESTTI